MNIQLIPHTSNYMFGYLMIVCFYYVKLRNNDQNMKRPFGLPSWIFWVLAVVKTSFKMKHYLKHY